MSLFLQFLFFRAYIPALIVFSSTGSGISMLMALADGLLGIASFSFVALLLKQVYTYKKENLTHPTVLVTSLFFILLGSLRLSEALSVEAVPNGLVCLLRWSLVFLAALVIYQFYKQFPKYLASGTRNHSATQTETAVAGYYHQHLQERLNLTERTANIGYFEWNLINNQITLSGLGKTLMDAPTQDTISYERFLELIHPADVKFVKDCFSKNLKVRQFKEFYFRVVNNHLQITYILLKAEVISTIAGTPMTVRGTLQDVSELRRQLQKIELQDSRLRKIAWIQSHKMRSPVATILGMVDLFNYQKPSDPVNMEILAHVKSLASRLDEMIKEVDELTRHYPDDWQANSARKKSP